MSGSKRLANQCCLSRSANGVWINDIHQDVNHMINNVILTLKEDNVIYEGDNIVFVSGVMDD